MNTCDIFLYCTFIIRNSCSFILHVLLASITGTAVGLLKYTYTVVENGISYKSLLLAFIVRLTTKKQETARVHVFLDQHNI